MRRLLLHTIAVFACVASFAQEPVIVMAGDRHVRIRAGGSGSGPVVVFEAGFTDSLESWNLVFPEVAKFARVFAYDRAGMGKSDPAAPERSYVAIVNELHDLLQRENVRPPYLLVGHSYGGALARVFYTLYPKDVAGVVFIDPMNEVFNETAPDVEQAIASQDARMKNAPAGTRAEWAYLKREHETKHVELKKYGAPDVPMALLIATMGRPPLWQQKLVEHYGAWILARSDSAMYVTPNSGHNIQREQPQLVIDAIRSVLFPNPLPSLRAAAAKNGSAAAIALFRADRARYPDGTIGPRILNTIGYELLGQKKTDAAIAVFVANVEAFPNDANAYDSLGEAYADAGDRDRAVANYRKSLELDPSNTGAARQIEKLTQQK